MDKVNTYSCCKNKQEKDWEELQCTWPHLSQGAPARSACGSGGPLRSWRHSCGNTATRRTRTRPRSRQDRAPRRPPLEGAVRPRSGGQRRPPLQETKTSLFNARRPDIATGSWSHWIKRRSNKPELGDLKSQGTKTFLYLGASDKNLDSC